MFSTSTKFIILPGNGCRNIEECNWYFNVSLELKKLSKNLEVVLRDMPDPLLARESIWLPFIENKLKCDADSIIIGHSSGAEAALRYAEFHQVLGLILVSACHTDLGDEYEKKSGYYSREWQWKKIVDNTKFIIQVHSKNDPLVPIEEGDFVAKQLNSKYYVFESKGHFLSVDFPELIDIIKDELFSKKS